MRRIPELDAVRGLAACVIVFAHVGLLPGSPWALSAVDLFFVLSGYLITTNIVANRQKPRFLPYFFVRRSLRIWPAYYLAFVACLILNQFLKWDTPPDGWPYYLTFTQNLPGYIQWPPPQFSGMFLHTWTLAVEEQFYLLWPLLLFRAGRRTSYALVISFIVLPPLMRSRGFFPILLLSRCDGLALGSLLALLVTDIKINSNPARLNHVRAAFLAMALAPIVAPWLLNPSWIELSSHLFTTRASITYFGVVGLLLTLQQSIMTAPFRVRILCHMGEISYGLYLYHPLVFAALPALYRRYIMDKLGLSSPLLRDCVMMTLSLALAELSFRLLEKPILAFKDRLTDKDALSTYRGPHRSRPAVPLDDLASS